MTRFLYDLRTPRQRGLVADERAAMHRAELERAARERRAARPAAPLSRWACGLIRGPRQADDFNGQIAALQHRVEHLERHLRALSERG